jgi:hypothetical protein
MQGQHINPKEKKRRKKTPRHIPTRSNFSFFLSFSHMERNDKQKGGPETRPPITINSETNVAMHFPFHAETLKIASPVSSLLLSHQFLPYHIT